MKMVSKEEQRMEMCEIATTATTAAVMDIPGRPKSTVGDVINHWRGAKTPKESCTARRELQEGDSTLPDRIQTFSVARN